MTLQLPTEQVWKEIEQNLFAVLGTVTPKSEMTSQPVVTQPFLTSELIDWLLASAIPTIRFKTRTELLGESANDAADDQAAIMQDGPVPALLAQQLENGTWVRPVHYYTPKYTSTHWTMLLLAELDIEPQNPQFQLGLEYMLTTTAAEIERGLTRSRLDLACLWGNVLRYVLHGGRADTRVERLIDYAVKSVQQGPCQCQYNSGYACAWGAVRALWGLAAIPPAQRTPAINNAIEQGLTFLLDTYQLVDANYPTPDNGKVHTLWTKLSFPLFYQVDILFTLRVLAELDALDQPGAQPALQWLAQRRQANGRWRGSSPYRTRTWRELGNSEETDRWISLSAAHILQQASVSL